MIDYTVYKLVHIFGLVLALGAIYAAATFRCMGISYGASPRRLLSISHGVGLFLMLLGGFGMLARLQIHWPWPSWVVLKIVLWLVAGGLIAVVKRAAFSSSRAWAGVALIAPLIGGIGAYFALYKP